MVLEEMLKKERKEGNAEGHAEEQNRFAMLITKLTADERLDELRMISTDKALLDRLYKEYDL